MSLLPYLTVSALPVSIATSLAFETLLAPRQAPYDPAREIPKGDLSRYELIYANLFTLYRNAVGALPSEWRHRATTEDIVEILQHDMEVLSSAVAIDSNDQVKLYYYYSDYSVLLRKAPKEVLFRTPKTEAQQLYHSVYEEVVRALRRLSDKLILETHDVVEPVDGRSKALIFTHVPYDLLAWKRFRIFELLESHTGLIKPRRMWYTKYYPVGERDLSVLPFLKMLLMIFGDHVLIKPMPLKLRTLILEIAQKRNWHALTTQEKVVFDLTRDLKEAYVIDVVKKLSHF